MNIMYIVYVYIYRKLKDPLVFKCLFSSNLLEKRNVSLKNSMFFWCFFVRPTWRGYPGKCEVSAGAGISGSFNFIQIYIKRCWWCFGALVLLLSGWIGMDGFPDRCIFCRSGHPGTSLLDSTVDGYRFRHLGRVDASLPASNLSTPIWSNQKTSHLK